MKKNREKMEKLSGIETMPRHSFLFFTFSGFRETKTIGPRWAQRGLIIFRFFGFSGNKNRKQQKNGLISLVIRDLFAPNSIFSKTQKMKTGKDVTSPVWNHQPIRSLDLLFSCFRFSKTLCIGRPSEWVLFHLNGRKS